MMAWILALFAFGLLLLTFRDGVEHMLVEWTKPDFSHGAMIPLISAFLIWQARHGLADIPKEARWVGVLIVIVALLIGMMGDLGTLYILIQIAIVTGAIGIVVAALGVRAGLYLWLPLLYLFFMVPWPEFVLIKLSQELQLISTQIGAAIVYQAGMSVFIEGNIIDLGEYNVQVAEACSGLRYLFPLLSFGVLVGYLYRGPIWQKAILVLSTVPIAILMNSFRIAVVAWLLNRFGVAAADDFLHDFEGWAVFLLCLGLLFVEAIVLAWVTPGPSNPLDRLNLSLPGRREGGDRMPLAAAFPTLAICAVFLGIAAGLSFMPAKLAVAGPARTSFADFPLEVGAWRGTRISIKPELLDVLQLTDYAATDFSRDLTSPPVNFYAAFYASQVKGRVVHSPRSCLPGGGGEIESLDVIVIDDMPVVGGSIEVNRALIGFGSDRQLVYYWFPQRERHLTNEYAVKWYLLVDAVIRGRTDGGLIRLTTPVLDSESPAEADTRLRSFLRPALIELPRFLPGLF